MQLTQSTPLPQSASSSLKQVVHRLTPALVVAAACGPAHAFTLGISTSICNLAKGMSFEVAAVIAVVAVASALIALFGGGKGHSVVVDILKYAIVVAGFVGLIPLVLQIWPQLSTYLC